MWGQGTILTLRLVQFVGAGQLAIAGLFISCGSLNNIKPELHYYNTVSHGQQLLDLQEALEKNVITQAEYDTLKQKIINNVVEFPELIDKIDLN